LYVKWVNLENAFSLKHKDLYVLFFKHKSFDLHLLIFEVKTSKIYIYTIHTYLRPRGQNRRKISLWQCIFDNMALYFECRINKTRVSFRRFGHSDL